MHLRDLRPLRCVAVGLAAPGLVVLGTGSLRAAPGDILNLGTLPGGANSYALGINTATSLASSNVPTWTVRTLKI